MDLLQLLYKRDEQFKEYTQSIYNEIPIVIESIGIYLSSFPVNNFHEGIVKWEDISLYEDNLMIFGMLTYNVGAVVDIDGEEMTITEDNAIYFQRAIRMGIPVELAIKGTTESIVHYLNMLHAKEQMHQRDLISTPMAGPEVSEKLGDEFDLDGLSDEQKQAYRMSETKGTLN